MCGLKSPKHWLGQRASGAVLLVHAWVATGASLGSWLSFLVPPVHPEISVTTWWDGGSLELWDFTVGTASTSLEMHKIQVAKQSKGTKSGLGHGVCLCLTGAGSPLWLYFGVWWDLMLQCGMLKSLGSKVLVKRSYIHWCCLCAYGTVHEYAWDWSHRHVCTQIIVFIN